MFQTIFVEKIKTRSVFRKLFSSKNRAVYDIMRKTIVEGGRPEMIIWRMRIACWIPKATNAYTEYNI